MTLKAEKFEELLASELTSSLEPQRGKALAAFRAHMAQEGARPAVAASVRPAEGREISRMEMAFWSSVPSLIAACLAVVVTLKILVPTTLPQTDGPAGMAGRTIILTPTAQQTETVIYSQGTVANDSQTRIAREQKERQTQWVDPSDQATYTLTQPGEAVEYKQIVPF